LINKKPILMRCFYLLLAVLASCIIHSSAYSQTYTLDWGASFTPAWAIGNTSGTATNVGGSNRTVTVTSGFTGAPTSWVTNYPQVNSNYTGTTTLFQVQNSADAIQLQMNLPNKTAYASFTIAFSAPVQNVSFAISDVDGPAAGATFTYLDSVTIIGAGPAGNVSPSLSKYTPASTIFNIDGPGVASANPANGANVASNTSGSPAQHGTLLVSFSGNAINSITINYTTKNIAAVAADPAQEAIAIGNLQFNNAAAPVTTNITNTIIASGLSTTPIAGITATDDESVTAITLATIPPAATGSLTYFNGTAWVAPAAGAILTPAQAASLRFDPAATFSGNATFTFFATDNRGITSATSTYNLLIEPTPPPTAINILAPAQNSSYGQTDIPSLSAAVSAGSITGYTVQTVPPATEGVLYLCNGACTMITAGQVIAPADIASLRFDPAATFSGTSNFTYTASTNNGTTSNTATYSIPVRNEAPAANAILAQAISNTAGATTIPSLSGGDRDGAVVSYTIATIPAPSEGVVQLCTPTCVNVTAGQVVPAANADKLTFIPAAGYIGNARFTYTATDNSGLNSAAAGYTIPVRGTSSVNMPPLSNNLVFPTLANTAGATLLQPLSATDVDGTIASYTIEAIPTAAQGTISYCSNGTEPCTGSTVVLSGVNALTPAQMATLKFTPTTNFTGTATFTYSATDNGGTKSNTARYSLPVMNVPPVTNPVTSPVMSNTYGQTTLPSLSGHDPSLISNYTITALPSMASGTLYLCNGVCLPVIAGQSIAVADITKLTFDPAAGFSGNATFSYTATDNNGASSVAAPYTIPVTANTIPAGASPTALNRSNPAIANTASAQGLSPLSATDGDGTIASYTINALPSAQSGTLTLCNPTCTPITPGQTIAAVDIANLRFTPIAGFEGNAGFAYSATDNSGKVSNTAQYTIPVTGRAPIAVNQQTSALLYSAASSAINPLSGSDADGTVVSYTVTSLPSASAGVLYLCNTTCAPVVAGQPIAAADAGKLQFDPALGYTGVFAQFNYTALDNTGKLSSQATYAIPLNSGSVLPVRLLSFTGKKSGETALLLWTAENEESFASYEVERSLGITGFSMVGRVNAQSGSGRKQYSQVDDLSALNVNKVYYRLRMNDKDGHFSYSQVVTMDLAQKSFGVSVANPVHDYARIQLSAPQKANVQLAIFDNGGRLVFQKQLTVQEGSQSVTIDEARRWSNGTYFLKVSAPTTQLSTQFLVQH
jgi:large repetitive protein